MPVSLIASLNSPAGHLYFLLPIHWKKWGVMQCHGGCLLINDTARCPLRYNGGSYNIRRFYGNNVVSRFKVGLKRLGRIGFSGC